jgi:hypothetical protein
MADKQPRKMRPGGGKSKGNGFESTVAKLLTKHLAPLNFIRTQGSGARVGGKNFDTIGQMFGEDALKLFVGDVVPINERDTGVRFNYAIECKFYKTPDNFTALAAGTANVYKWYQEAVTDAAKIGRIPMLVFKWNHTPIFVGVGDECTFLRHRISPNFTLKQGNYNINIYGLDHLLAYPFLWCEGPVATAISSNDSEPVQIQVI